MIRNKLNLTNDDEQFMSNAFATINGTVEKLKMPIYMNKQYAVLSAICLKQWIGWKQCSLYSEGCIL